MKSFVQMVLLVSCHFNVLIGILNWKFVLFLKDVLWANSGGPYHTTSELSVGSCSPRRLGVFRCKYDFFFSVQKEKRALNLSQRQERSQFTACDHIIKNK